MAWTRGIGLALVLCGLTPLAGGPVWAADINWSDPVQESAAAMRAGLYLGDLRACAWSRLPAYRPYGTLSSDDLDAGLVRLLPRDRTEDPGVVQTARRGFILATRTKQLLDAETCAALSATVREDLGVDPRVTQDP
ncbi:MAG: hypothetical protein K9H25_18205 [Rhodospirillum sp.]|nr:hypothetical protein [Rhodospirillum sp.]MCF8490831.1 hypothetical protein [Rhodospirillum sp.]MCF8501390.1 hypothetical protein [Rhodospirillum sp.]